MFLVLSCFFIVFLLFFSLYLTTFCPNLQKLVDFSFSEIILDVEFAGSILRFISDYLGLLIFYTFYLYLFNLYLEMFITMAGV